MIRKFLTTITAVALLVCCFATPALAAEINNEEAASLATEATIYIQQGESYAFYNTSASVTRLSWSKTPLGQEPHVMDYVYYKANGDIFGWFSNSNSKSSGGSVNVMAGAITICTGVSEVPVKLTYDSSIVSVMPAAHPAVYRVFLDEGESYTLTNHSSSEYATISWTSNVGEMVRSEYKANGTLSKTYTSDLSKPSWGTNIWPGGKVVFNVIRCETPVEITAPYSIYAPTE